jgi:hypothetical protein
MNCNDIEELLTAYLERTTTPEEQAEVINHLNSCPRCRREIELLRATQESLGDTMKLAASQVEPPPESWQIIAKNAGIKARDKKVFPLRPRLAWLAVPLFILIVAVFTINFFTSTGGGFGAQKVEPPSVISDGYGGAILAWVDEPYGRGIYTQNIDAEGNLLWGDGILIRCNIDGLPHIANNEEGGAVIYWQYKHTYYAQHISSSGDILWDKGGIPLGDVPPEYASFPTSSGWQLSYDEKTISVSGASGIVIYKNPSFDTLGYSRAIDDGMGGVIVASRAGEGRSLSQTYSVYVQRIDAAGNRLWGDGGLEVQHVGSSPLLLIIAALVILLTSLVIFGVFRGSELARRLTAISAVLISTIALFGCVLILFTSGHPWFYITNVPVNVLAISVIPIAGFILATFGFLKKTGSRLLMTPIMLYCLLVVVLVIFLFFS